MTGSRWPRYGAALLGLVWYFHLGGIHTLNPLNIGWLLDGDWRQHWLGWLFFRREPWTFPLGTVTSLAYPIGTTIGFTDSNPLVSLLLKPFSGVLPGEFQFIGPWLAFCFMMQGYLGAALTSTVTKDAGQQLLGGWLFALSPVLSARVGHDTLCAQWLLLGLLYLGFREYADAKAARRGAALSAATTLLAAAIHPYLAAMCWTLAHANYLRLWRGRLMTLGRASAMALATTAGMLAVLGTIGYFGEAGMGSSGFGVYSADLVTLIDSREFSRLLPAFHLPGGQWEGLGFVGLGGLVAGAVAILALVRARPSLRPGVWIIIVACVLMSIYALSAKVTLAGEQVASLRRLYRSLTFITEPFRASGRFIWPLHYLALLGGIWGTTRILGHSQVSAALGPSRRSAATAILAVAVALQATDFKGNALMFAEKPFRQASAAALAPARGRYQHMAIYPMQVLGACGDKYEEDHVYRFMLEAYRLKTTFNSGIFARLPLARMQEACGDLFRAVDAGRLDAHTIYIVSPSFVPGFKDAGAACGRFDGDWYCVSRDSDETYRTYLETGKIIDRK